MGTRDPRIDAYISASADFAKPILEHLRGVVHAACPDVEETMKWSFPHFQYEGMLCSMASFKAHCAFGFWKGALVVGDESKDTEAMGNLGRITSVKDLPSKKVLAGWIRKAMALNEQGIAAPKKRKPGLPAKSALRVPQELAEALDRNPKARATFDAFPPSQRKEYVDWVAEAKTDATREKRLATTIEWLSEGKQRNWKYQKAR
jgi:uncharacterized protein YdeI (YjbR/CyaY-like superfamily)